MPFLPRIRLTASRSGMSMMLTASPPSSSATAMILSSGRRRIFRDWSAAPPGIIALDHRVAVALGEGDADALERERHRDAEVLQHLGREIIRVRIQREGEGVEEARVEVHRVDARFSALGAQLVAVDHAGASPLRGSRRRRCSSRHLEVEEGCGAASRAPATVLRVAAFLGVELSSSTDPRRCSNFVDRPRPRARTPRAPRGVPPATGGGRARGWHNRRCPHALEGALQSLDADLVRLRSRGTCSSRSRCGSR